MRIHSALFFILVFFHLKGKAQNTFTLLNLSSKLIVFSDTCNCKARVILFLSPECPLCQSYSLTYNTLFDKYKEKGIDFLLVIPGKGFTLKSVKAFRKKYHIKPELYLDTEKKLVYRLKASITPEAFLLDNSGELLYSGRIDNWAYELGKKRSHITQSDLEDAIKFVLEGSPKKVQSTTAIGCFIE
jgi:peroxiredoxin